MQSIKCMSVPERSLEKGRDRPKTCEIQNLKQLTAEGEMDSQRQTNNFSKAHIFWI